MNVAAIRMAHKSFVDKAQEDNEAYQAKYYARPVSYYLAWLFIKWGYTPNQVSVLAFMFGVIGSLAIASGNYAVIIFGVLLMNVRHVLDYADGTLARATNKASKFGCYLDRLCDEFIGVILPMSIGVGLYFNPHTAHPMIMLILGVSYALVTAMSALSIAQVALVYGITPHNFYQPKRWGLWRLIYVVGTNLQSSSVILLLPFAILNKLDWYLVFYLILTLCEMSAAITVRMINHENS